MSKYVLKEGKMVKVEEKILMKPNIKVVLNNNGSVKFDFSDSQEIFDALEDLLNGSGIKVKSNKDDKEILFF